MTGPWLLSALPVREVHLTPTGSKIVFGDQRNSHSIEADTLTGQHLAAHIISNPGKRWRISLEPVEEGA